MISEHLDILTNLSNLPNKETKPANSEKGWVGGRLRGGRGWGRGGRGGVAGVGVVGREVVVKAKKQYRW